MSASPASRKRVVIKVDLLGGKVRSRIFVGDALLGAQVGGPPANAVSAGGVGELPSSAALPVLAPKVRSLSEVFTAALFDRERKELLDRLVHVKGGRTGVEVVVEAEPAVAHLPFELLRVRPNQFLVDSPGAAFYRRVSVGEGPRPRPAAAPRPGRLSILTLAPIDGGAVVQGGDGGGGDGLAAIYADALATGDAEVTTIAAGHERSFVEALRSRQFHVVHVFAGPVGFAGFAGFAGPTALAGAAGNPSDAVTFRSPAGVRAMTAERLAALLADAAVPVPLVVVGGRTRRPDELAQELVQRGVGRVLATQDELVGQYAPSSTVTTREFFAALAADPGLTAAGALSQARQALVARHPDDERDHHGARLVRSYWTTVHTLFVSFDDPPIRDGGAIS